MPLKAKSYRVDMPFDEASQLAVESDVRISGVSVGKVKAIELSDDGLADATIEIDAKFAPIPSDTRAILRQKTLLGETYVELTPGRRRCRADPRGRRPAAPRRSPTPSSSTRSSAPSTSRPRVAFQTWMVGRLAWPCAAAAPTSTPRSATSPRSPSAPTT